MVRSLQLGICGVAAAAVACLLAGPALAQNSSQQSTTGTGTIFQPIALTKTSDLSFGTLVRPASGSGVVSINAADGVRSLTGSGALLSGGPNNAPSRAAYTVSGEGGQTFSITVPASFSMTRSGGSETLAITLDPTATSGTLSGSLGAQGSASFGVGGSVSVGDTTATGSYAGSFNVTVAYN